MAGRFSDGNVFLHVLDADHQEQVASLRHGLDNWLVLAVDLAEHRARREEARAVELGRVRAGQQRA